jgi:hypothetical protein
MMVLTGIVFADTTAKEQAAIVAAEQWLALVDAANYTDSWQTAAEILKGPLPKNNGNIRSKQGAHRLRSLKFEV